MSILDPSKGVDYYTYLSRDPFKMAFEYPKDHGKKKGSDTVTDIEKMYKGNRQIKESDIGLLEHTGRFKWNAYYKSGKEYEKVESRYVEIGPLMGDMGKTNMGDMLKTPSVIAPGYTISYGYYDSGAGIGSLTNQNQSWVYMTDSYSDWMKGLAKDSAINDRPFGTFVLPGAHDAGMYDLKEIDNIINDAQKLSLLVSLLSPVVGLTASAILALSKNQIKRIIINLAFTQKDKITTMLDLGIRFFDFRPGYGYSLLNNGKLYHQHSFIPGYPYDKFLKDILNWLKDHKNEIVVISLAFSGFMDKKMRPAVETLNSYMNNAMNSTGMTKEIVIGNKTDLKNSYKDLLAAKKRILFMNEGVGVNDAVKYDSYSDSAYQTTKVSKIISALNAMSREGEKTDKKGNKRDSDLTVFQLQGTANATGGGIYKSIATLSDASSPLLSTKPGFDHETYKWAKDNISKKFTKTQLAVLLNDFADNAMVSHAIQITKQRI